MDVLNRLLGDPNEKELRRLRPVVQRVRAIHTSDEFRTLTTDDLPRKTEEFRERVRAGAGLDALLPEAFALVIRACELIRGRTASFGKQTFTWDMVPYDVQIVGGVALHRSCIAEMKTGEGKTLVCTMPVYLNALTGRGVHIVTVNDYLAHRDSVWMGMLYTSLGLTVGTIVHGVDPESRKQAYNCDVTYGTNNEFGFDYLRDNMASSLDTQVQRPLHYAIVDEVDSILIDEARTPLIISQPAGESTDKYLQYMQLVRQMKEHADFNRDDKQRVATLTEEGIARMEQLLGIDNIYTERGFGEVHHIEQALRAHAIYQRDVDYVVKDGEVIIVDEFTGRLMPGRRYSHGLHQAIEAKEGVEVQRESKTLATITFQNYFRLYEKLAGMTGTAKTEEEEFESIYRLRTVVIPTHQPVVRMDRPDAIYRTVEAKFRAAARIAGEKHVAGQPVLIGTTSVEKSEAMSALLKTQGIPHQVLNAKYHEKEAEIVMGAGQKGAVTIATNMAGRGTDIKLGEGVVALGGLAILGTERHEARRIDNQLRGRSGRQGDPGESQFFVSMEDDLMRLFGGDRLKTMMERLNVPDDVPLENRMVSRSIEGAQKRVEGRNFDIRRHVVQYDDVMNKHREIIYQRRQAILQKLAETGNGKNGAEAGEEENPLHADILSALRGEAFAIVSAHASARDPGQWDRKEICEIAQAFHPAFAGTVTEGYLDGFGVPEEMEAALRGLFVSFYEEKCARDRPATVALAERVVTLRSIDTHWMDHIDDMAHLREQVSFAGFAQRDPLIEYKDQGFRRFAQLLRAIDATIARTVLQVDFAQFAPRVLLARAAEGLSDLRTNEDQISAELTETGVDEQEAGGWKLEAPVAAQGSLRGMAGRASRFPLPAYSSSTISASSAQRMPGKAEKAGRNDPCPCGSGKKYKKCHGR